MIIGRHAVYEVARFRERLAQAERSVVRVATGGDNGTPGSPRCTGWLVTPDLVVIAGFALAVAAEVVECEQLGDRVRAELVFGDVKDTERPALLRLVAPLKARTLRLAPGAAAAGESVFVMQHTQRQPELRFSIGRVLERAEAWLRYDADTDVGSSGAPVLDSGWGVVGMHMRGSERYNEGLTLAALVESLREAPQWPEIAERHRLTDVAQVRRAVQEQRSDKRETHDSVLLGAAVQWSVDPSALAEDDAARLRPLVADPTASRWILPAAERSSLLRSAGSLDELRNARGDAPARDPGQLVIDRILAGPPYPLDDIDESELPYWLQATRWFAGVADNLPTPAEIGRALERRRVRSQLHAIAGDPFRGRTEQLARLRDWYGSTDPGPIVITGIGGVGKSALVAQFALSLPPSTLLLRLDFDRADLAPDDSVSVLHLLFEQMTVQLEGFEAPALDRMAWGEAVAVLGKLLDRRLEPAFAPLLVLDGFEVAQYVRDHREIWQLLEQLLDQVPRLRVLVSGRATVTGLALRGRPAEVLTLEGLEEPDARAWLADGGIEDERVLERVVEISRGVPLILRLAVLWARRGGRIEELPEALPKQLVEGFLYERILDRVIDPELKALARDALVLRRLTEEMVPSILRDTLPNGADAAHVFARLARELALVDETPGPGLTLPGSRVLKLRPEVRTATLQLLEAEPTSRVRMIDERAAKWYAGRDPDDLTNAAELVYHRLRLGDVDGAAQAWRPGCGALLGDAEADLSGAERAWLRARAEPGTSSDLADWEHGSRERITALLGRGLMERVPAVLGERHDRTANSPLRVYDAWWRWRGEGDAAAALELLDAQPSATGAVARDRRLVAARLAVETGDEARADAELALIEGARAWEHRADPRLDALTVTAARIRLTVKLELELELLRQLRAEPSRAGEVRALLPSTDVVLPALANAYGVELESEAIELRVPRDEHGLERFVHALDEARQLSASASPPPILEDSRAEGEDASDGWKRLAALGVRRWRLVATRTFLESACALLDEDVSDQQRMSILGALAALAGHERGTFLLWHETHGPLVYALARVGPEAMLSLTPPPPEDRLELAAVALGAQRSPAFEAVTKGGPPSVKRTVFELTGGDPQLQALAFQILSPDPLEILVRRVLGVPDSVPL